MRKATAVFRMVVVAAALTVGCGGDGPGDGGLVDTATDTPVADVATDGPDARDAAGACAEHVFEDTRIPMRDGASLAVFVRRPTDTGCRLPTVLVQTPYDKENARALWFDDPASNPLFGSTAYAFVVLDWRGSFGSDDSDADAMKLGDDGFDAVEWIATQSWSDGTVGTFGPSALCRVQYRTAAEHPRALRAAVPIFCPRREEYEHYFPGGVLRREYLQALGILFGTAATILEEHPTHDALWTGVERSTDPAASIQIPMLLVSGWWDLSPAVQLADLRALQIMSDPSVRDEHRLLIGPWTHFATNAESSGIGRPYTDEERTYFDNEQMIQRDTLAFFDLHLRGLDSDAASWTVVRYATGASGVLETSDAWPPADSVDSEYFLGAGGTLSTASPGGPTVDVDFPYDPADPSPTIGGMTLRFDLLHGPTDQAEVIARPDARTFVTAPFTETLSIRGRITARLTVRTSSPDDTDFAVRIADVAPDGTWLWIGEGIRRLSLRDDFATRSPVEAGTAYEVPVELANHLAYDLAPGQALGVIVTSSNFPRFDVNPNDGEDFLAPGGGVAVTNTVIVDGESRLVIPVAP